MVRSSKIKGNFICGYVIIPNHLHALIAFRNSGRSINTIIGNGKRFMAYELVERLRQQKEEVMLNTLASYVQEADRIKGQLHEVFELSLGAGADTQRRQEGTVPNSTK